MAQLQIVLNQEEIHPLFVAGDKNKAFVYIPERVLNGFLRKEIVDSRQENAMADEAGEVTVPQRNGTYSQSRKTNIGTLHFEVPRFRNDEETKFKAVLFDNYDTADAAFPSGPAELVFQGMST